MMQVFCKTTYSPKMCTSSRNKRSVAQLLHLAKIRVCWWVWLQMCKVNYFHTRTPRKICFYQSHFHTHSHTHTHIDTHTHTHTLNHSHTHNDTHNNPGYASMNKRPVVGGDIKSCGYVFWCVTHTHLSMFECDVCVYECVCVFRCVWKGVWVGVCLSRSVGGYTIQDI